MKKLGLEVRLKKLIVPHWVRGEEKGELVDTTEWRVARRKKSWDGARWEASPRANGLIAEIVVVSNSDELRKART